VADADLHATVERKRVVSYQSLSLRSSTYLYVAYRSSASYTRYDPGQTYLVYRVLPILTTRHDGFLDHRVKALSVKIDIYPPALDASNWNLVAVYRRVRLSLSRSIGVRFVWYRWCIKTV
jgi:hypothetical protein